MFSWRVSFVADILVLMAIRKNIDRWRKNIFLNLHFCMEPPELFRYEAAATILLRNIMSVKNSLMNVARKLKDASESPEAKKNKSRDCPDMARVLVAVGMEDVALSREEFVPALRNTMPQGLEIIALTRAGERMGSPGRITLDDNGQIWIAWDGLEKMDPESGISDCMLPSMERGTSKPGQNMDDSPEP